MCLSMTDPEIEGFAADALVSTDAGLIPVSWLAIGDRVRVIGGQTAAVTGVRKGACATSMVSLETQAMLCSDADLSEAQGLCLSAGVELVIASPLVELYFAEPQALCRAATLGLETPDQQRAVYAISFAEPQIIRVGGVWASCQSARGSQWHAPFVTLHDDEVALIAPRLPDHAQTTGQRAAG